MEPETPQPVDRGKSCAHRKDDGSYCLGFRTADSVFCVGHRRGQKPHSNTQKLTPGRLIQRLLGRMNREMSRLNEFELALTQKLQQTEGLEERIELFKELQRIEARRDRMLELNTDLEDKRLRNTIAAIVAGSKAGYSTEDLRKLVAAGKAE